MKWIAFLLSLLLITGCSGLAKNPSGSATEPAGKPPAQAAYIGREKAIEIASKQVNLNGLEVKDAIFTETYQFQGQEIPVWQVEFATKAEKRPQSTYFVHAVTEEVVWVTTPPSQGTRGIKGLYPVTARTGTPVIDRVIEAVTQNDATSAGNLAVMTPVPCTTQPGAMTEQPPCEGKPEGTPVELFPAYGCQPVNLYSLEQVRSLFQSMLSQPLYLYAVYRADGKVGKRSLAYAMTFANRLEDPAAKTIFIDAGGSIAMLWRGCGTPGSVVPKDPSRFILAPKEGQMG